MMASEVPDEKYTEIAFHGCLVLFETATAILRFVCILSKTVFSEFTTDPIEITLPATAATVATARMKKKKKKKKISDIIVIIIIIHKLSYH